MPMATAQLTGLTAVQQAVIDPRIKLFSRWGLVPLQRPGPITVEEAVWMLQDGRDGLIYGTADDESLPEASAGRSDARQEPH
jgi:hypothetical protein